MYVPTKFSRVCGGGRLAGAKAELPDEFLTRSQLVGGTHTTVGAVGDDLAVHVDLSDHDAGTRIVSRRTASALSLTLQTTGTALDLPAADHAHAALVSSGGVTVLTAPRAGFYRTDVALRVGRDGGSGLVDLELLFVTTTPSHEYVADRGLLGDALVTAQAVSLHGHTEMLLFAGGELRILVRSSAPMPAVISGSLTIRFDRSA